MKKIAMMIAFMFFAVGLLAYAFRSSTRSAVWSASSLRPM